MDANLSICTNRCRIRTGSCFPLCQKRLCWQENYDLYFKYKDKEYFVLNEYNYVAVCDENYTEEYEVYANEMEFIENFKIDGKPLIELIDKLEEVDPM